MRRAREPAGPDYYPELGEVVYDHLHDRTGHFMGTVGGQVYLRPLEGGCEWTTYHSEIEASLTGREMRSLKRGFDSRRMSGAA
ncbi:hypothetical protein SAMN05216371_1322 [Streptomyces sp. TLI_053]|uniref:hypothetical protein n=1 Tax=Streptomyces sp. TLI_053 TaxID=1855352 RepID=UPI00087C397B|nr:hypothetical protein [Streptomyces sp. TLI_053]SDT11578.1 hypothetical protein SAMN05216371_1322 [Streptomyces sp. TLI_053]